MNASKRSSVGLLVVLALIFFFNTVDYFATLDLVAHGEHGEWNPLMRALIGTPYFALYKLVLIPIGLLLLWLTRRHVVPKYLRFVWATCGLYALLMVYTWAVFYS